MGWFAEPSVKAILADANRVAPHRTNASDGTIGDAAHSASTSDHNPDTDGGVHACDVTNDPAGGFDAWYWAHVVSQRMAAGLEHRIHYIVSNSGTGPDMIYNPGVHGNQWVQNGSYKTEHRSHVHFSILYTDAAEQDVSQIFVIHEDHPLPPTPINIPWGETVYVNYDNQLHGFYVSHDKRLMQRFEAIDAAIHEYDISTAVHFGPVDPTRGVKVAVAPNGDLVVGIYGTDGVFNEARWAKAQGKWLPHTYR